MLNNWKVDFNHVELDYQTREDIQKIVNSVVSRYNIDPSKANNLRKMLENEAKYINSTMLLNDAGMTTAHIDTFKALAFITTSRFYVGSILDEIAVVSPVKSPKGDIFVVDFEYVDNFTDPVGGNITGGDKLRNKRTAQYTQVPELTQPRRIRAVIRERSYTCQARPIEQSITLQAYISMQSIYTKDQVDRFLDNDFVQVISAKLRDEAEVGILRAYVNNVEQDKLVDFTCGGNTDCESKKCDSYKLLDTIDNVAYTIMTKSGVRPNVIVIGERARRVLSYADRGRTILEYTSGGISGIAREIIGSLDRRYKVVYDPLVDGVILAYVNKNENIAPVVYTPFIPIAMTQEMMERDLTSYRIIYTVDGWLVVHPELIGYVRLHNC